ncbi:MAG: type III pantothenate kinase [Planctomycetota bacterium]|nr:type III pantothenate kinase [Planctomycetota bacterium]MDA1106477.1 type III pantothenate kinase [Planctomycetota bacterium]
MASIIAISVGNSRTSISRIEEGTIVESVREASEDARAVAAAAKRLAAGELSTTIIATVAPTQSEAIAIALKEIGSGEIALVGEEIGIPIATKLADGANPGQDRLLCATAAWRRLGQACVVIDAGTCITVDFIDGKGTFHGGAIAPGWRMQLHAMHAGTEGLPELSPEPITQEPYGADTASAMRLGVVEGLRGMVQRLVERYAMAYGAFPLVIATGGDAAALFEDDELVNLLVPDLVIEGIACAWAAATGSEDDAPKFGDTARPRAHSE